MRPRVKLTPEIQAFIEAYLQAEKEVNYTLLIRKIVRQFGVHISKAAISKRAKALKIVFQRGRKRILPLEKRPPRSIFLDGAGAFFLKGAEIELGLLNALNQLFRVSRQSAPAKKALRSAQSINACLLYAPIFGLAGAEGIADYRRQGLLYLTQQKELPDPELIAQYLRYLANKKLLDLVVQEVTKFCSEALLIRIDALGQTFYLDAQLRTVWPNSKVAGFFSRGQSRVRAAVQSIFQSPSAQRPLVLQAVPGYTFLPPEMFNLMQCFEQAQQGVVRAIAVVGNAHQTLTVLRDIHPQDKCYFIAPLSPWQYAHLVDTKVVKDFRQYVIGRQQEPMAVAEARINLLNPQLNENIIVRGALVRRKEERLALITNIAPNQERYIRKIVDSYFSHWLQPRMQTYYDLLEEAHSDVLARDDASLNVTHTLTNSYNQGSEEMFRLLLTYLHQYSLRHFFPPEYQSETWLAMCANFYRQSGYLKIKQDCWEVFLRPFSEKKLQTAAQFACQRFNQCNILLPDQKHLRIFPSSG